MKDKLLFSGAFSFSNLGRQPGREKWKIKNFLFHFSALQHDGALCFQLKLPRWLKLPRIFQCTTETPQRNQNGQALDAQGLLHFLPRDSGLLLFSFLVYLAGLYTFMNKRRLLVFQVQTKGIRLRYSFFAPWEARNDRHQKKTSALDSCIGCGALRVRGRFLGIGLQCNGLENRSPSSLDG
jgi:hypothetical protein